VKNVTTFTFKPWPLFTDGNSLSKGLNQLYSLGNSRALRTKIHLS